MSLLPVGGKEVLNLMRPVLIREHSSCTCINAQNCLEKIGFCGSVVDSRRGRRSCHFCNSVLKRLLMIHIYSYCLDRCVTQRRVRVLKAKGKLWFRFTQIRNAPSEPAERFKCALRACVIYFLRIQQLGLEMFNLE